MTIKSLLRSGSFCLAVVLVGACSNSSDSGGGGLLGAAGGPLVGAITITGPTIVAPGVDEAGFTATLKTGTIAVPADALTVTVTSGTPSIYTANPAMGGMEEVGTATAKTDATGRIYFSYEAPATVTMPSSATITVSSADYVDATGAALKQTFVVSINPATFQFISPDPNTSIKVGSANAVPLQFEWTQATSTATGTVGTTGVAGSVNLTVSNTSGAGTSGSTSAQTGPVLVINGSPQNETANPTANVMTVASSDGGFSVPVSVFDNNRGFATITATNAANVNQTATITLQFIDVPTSSNLVANPLTIPPATTQDSTSALTYTVDNQANQPIGGVDVTFTLINPTGAANERVFPLGGTTDQNGVVTSKYYAGNLTGTVTVEACVEGTSVCDSRVITISTGATGTTTTTTTGTVALAGPTNIGQHTIYNNFTATLDDASGNPVVGTFLNLSPIKGGGNIYAPPGTANENSGGAVTDSNGQVAFSYMNSGNSNAAQSIIIEGSASVGGMQVSQDFTLTINPDVFQITSPAQPTAPATATPEKTGKANAAPLAFNWMRLFETSSTSTTTMLEPFGGTVMLSVTGSALIESPGAADASTATVNTDATGHFPSGVAIYDATAETVTLTATDGDGFGYSTTLPLQFSSP